MNHFEDEQIEQFYVYQLAVPTRTIYIGSISAYKDEVESGIDFQMAERVTKATHILETMGNGEITFILNNYGGDEYHGLAIYDIIKHCKCPTKIVVYGSAMSMASVIMQAANKRVMAPNSTLMVHMGSMNLTIDQRDTESYHDEIKRLNDLINQIYLDRIREKNPRFSINQLKDLLSTDRFMTPGKSVEIGLADEVMK